MFLSQTTYKIGGIPVSLAVTDVSDYNKPDIVIANYASNIVGILYHC
jgi:hypothetical protein